MIGFRDSIRLFYKNYVNFEGRATRAEYWWPTLMQVLIYFLLIVIFFSIIGTGDWDAENADATGVFVIMMIGVIFFLVNLLPGISVKVRRFHDLNQTGWLVLVFWGVNLIVPVVEFARMIWFALPGTMGTNRYGPDPHVTEAEIFE